MFIINKLIIDRHYCGPSGSGNGGYSAGIIAANVPFPAEVTLRKPPPLDRPMRLVVDGKTAQLLDGEECVAEAKEVSGFELEIPPPVSFEEAEKASPSFYGFGDAPFPNCFVCGKNRQPGKGLKIHPGKVRELTVASPWIPYPGLGDANGTVNPIYIWAALDCPGAWSLLDHDIVVVLGRFAVKQVALVEVGKKYVAMGWVTGNEGRKTWTGTAIFDEKGEVCAYAKATWISIKQ